MQNRLIKSEAHPPDEPMTPDARRASGWGPLRLPALVPAWLICRPPTPPIC